MLVRLKASCSYTIRSGCRSYAVATGNVNNTQKPSSPPPPSTVESKEITAARTNGRRPRRATSLKLKPPPFGMTAEQVLGRATTDLAVADSNTPPRVVKTEWPKEVWNIPNHKQEVPAEDAMRPHSKIPVNPKHGLYHFFRWASVDVRLIRGLKELSFA